MDILEAEWERILQNCEGVQTLVTRLAFNSDLSTKQIREMSCLVGWLDKSINRARRNLKEQDHLFNTVLLDNLVREAYSKADSIGQSYLGANYNFNTVLANLKKPLEPQVFNQ